MDRQCVNLFLQGKILSNSFSPSARRLQLHRNLACAEQANILAQDGRLRLISANGATSAVPYTGKKKKPSLLTPCRPFHTTLTWVRQDNGSAGTRHLCSIVTADSSSYSSCLPTETPSVWVIWRLQYVFIDGKVGTLCLCVCVGGGGVWESHCLKLRTLNPMTHLHLTGSAGRRRWRHPSWDQELALTATSPQFQFEKESAHRLSITSVL